MDASSREHQGPISATLTFPRLKSGYLLGIPVRFDIDPGTVKKAEQCPWEHACLSDSYHNRCKVIEHLHDSVIFVECDDEKECPYMKKHLSLCICICPVREEIYRKYGV